MEILGPSWKFHLRLETALTSEAEILPKLLDFSTLTVAILNLLSLLEKHNALELLFYILFCFSATFFLEYWEIWSKKIFLEAIEQLIQFSYLLLYKRKFF